MTAEDEIPVLYETQVLTQHVDESDSDIRFGTNLALDGRRLAIAKGPVWEWDKGFDSVELFELHNGSWQFIKHIQSPTPYDHDYFIVPAIDQDTLVVGAYSCSDINCSTEYGAAYVYERNEGGEDNWGFLKKLNGGNRRSAAFGYSTTIHKDTIAISAHFETIGGVEAAGAVYLFERNQGGVNQWGLVKRLESDNAEKSAYETFGGQIIVQHNTLVVRGDAGSVIYVYGRHEGGENNWGMVQKFHLPHPFGVYTAIDFDGSTIAVRTRNPCLPSDETTNHLLFYERGEEGNWALTQDIEVAVSVHSPSLDGNQLIVRSYSGPFAYLYQREYAPDSWRLVKQLQINPEVLIHETGLSIAPRMDAGRALLGIREANGDTGVVAYFDVAEPINSGQAGAWFNPSTPGQGQLIDVDPESQFIFLSWFTYTDANSTTPNEQRWLTAQGQYTGNKAVLPLYETLGGAFDDPKAVSTEQIGEVTMSFTDCGLGRVDYRIYGEDLSGSFPIGRVIPGSEAVCVEKSENALQTVDINAGMDGAWYDLATPGQGFLFDVHPDPQGGNFIFVAWFTYGDDTAAGQRWLTAQGPFEGSTAEIDVYETTGGNFDDPQPTETTPMGTMTIDFSDCSNAQLSYSLADDGVAGAIDITRLLAGGKALCEELAGTQ